MTVLKIKVEERLKLCHGDRVTPQVYATFRKDILEYIHEMEVCITKLELSHTPETDVLETEVSWASQLMEYHIELSVGTAKESSSPPISIWYSISWEAQLTSVSSTSVLLTRTAGRT